MSIASANINKYDPGDSTISLGRKILKIYYDVKIALSVQNITNTVMRQTTSGDISEFCSDF